MAIREGSGFTKKRRKKTEAEGKTLVAWVNQHPVGGRGPREWTPQNHWPRRESTAQKVAEGRRASVERGEHTVLST